MPLAICIRCGHKKRKPFVACTRCQYDPRGDHRAMAMSLLVSTQYFDPNRERCPTDRELDEASQHIMAGDPLQWDEEAIGALMREQLALAEHGSPSWTKVIVFLMAVILIPAIVVAVIVAVTRFIVHR